LNLERNNQLRIQVQKFELRNKGISSRTNTAIRAIFLRFYKDENSFSR